MTTGDGDSSSFEVKEGAPGLSIESSSVHYCDGRGEKGFNKI